ncbi:MAG: hypothetical protein ABH864_05315 [archaeon]
MKNRGQIGVIVIFVVLVVVAVASFFFYYSGTSVTGEVSGGKKVEIVERASAAENLVVPDELKVVATIGKDNEKSFEVANFNEEIVRVSCNFPAFQEFVPSSNCFTYDREGNFVGSDKDVQILPGKKQVFVASVTPFENIRIRKESRDIVVDINPGEYNGEIELNAWFEGAEEKTVSVVNVPVRIFVE